VLLSAILEDKVCLHQLFLDRKIHVARTNWLSDLEIRELLCEGALGDFQSVPDKLEHLLLDPEKVEILVWRLKEEDLVVKVLGLLLSVEALHNEVFHEERD